MTDADGNGIPDDGQISFHLRSAIAGAVIALALGGSSIGLVKAIFPESQILDSIGAWFAGGACSDACKQVEADLRETSALLTTAEKALICYQTGATLHGISDIDCRHLLDTGNPGH